MSISIFRKYYLLGVIISLILLIAMNTRYSRVYAEQALMLKGEISHSDYLPPVNESLAKLNITNVQDIMPPLAPSSSNNSVNSVNLVNPVNSVANPAPVSNLFNGQVAEQNNIPKQVNPVTVYAEWFPLPFWMAGKWHKEGDLTVQVQNLQTGLISYPNQFISNRMDLTLGHQKDVAGNVWHVNLIPTERDGMSSSDLVRFLIVAQKCESSDQNLLITRTHYVVSEVEPRSGQLMKMFQQESLNRYSRDLRGYLLNRSSNRIFSSRGLAERDGQLESRFNKTADFVPTPYLQGYDLAASLNSYLDANGLSHLKK